MSNYLLAGAAGFIGSWVTEMLLDMGHNVFGVDNLNAAYDIRMKSHRLDLLLTHPNFVFTKLDIADRSIVDPDKFHLNLQPINISTLPSIDAIINQKGKNVICIYAYIGKPYSSLIPTIDLLKSKEALNYTIIVSGAASTSTGEQYLTPYAAAMLGEYFMQQGKDVFVVFDDLTKHAWVYRQISLLLERAPGREAYPGDIFYLHSQLMERAGYLNKELGGGSMTFFPIIEILQGDVTGYIPTNLISMTDGQLYFSTDLFNRGFKPAIDFGLSVSRIGNKAQWPAM